MARTFIVNMWILIELVCFAMSIYIGVGWNGPPPAWVITMYVAHGMTMFLTFIYEWRDPAAGLGTTDVKLRVAAVLIPWLLTGGFMLKGGLNCHPESGRFFITGF
ncbi:hypothetical protein CALVIDRAFT_566394 [Calocera viscosa TUFC12733]|uniref:Uncharacterized protein n=1 Tax=Calocera viscosa (strain TUFC12733) TaxID=1330018 RepID=A0A167JJL0_CALVF|nr:hypothetical protein CALVIDRAFT_566394 [Calocera viscosa TUFC12733]